MDKKQEMILAIKDLNNAFYKLLSVWNLDDANFLNNSESISIYPFPKSFDEVFNDVNDWTSAAIEELQK